MNKPVNVLERVLTKAQEDSEFRKSLIASPNTTIKESFGITLDSDHEIVVHESTAAKTHLVLPPKSKFTAAEREAARVGATSLEFLKKTMYDPAPPMRPLKSASVSTLSTFSDTESLATAVRKSIVRGLGYIKSRIADNGAWHCIRFNLGNPDIPRHFERPPFVTALCTLALQSSKEPQARAICAKSRSYLVDSMEFPGLWRYYRHLPQDLDSSTLCSLVVDTHPWIGLGRNIPRLLANRDEDGRFMTWILEEDEPSVVATFRIEADPVVNANVISYIGDHPSTKQAQKWLEELIIQGDKIEGSSKWYHDPISLYYAISRAMTRVPLQISQKSSVLAERILGLRNEGGDFRDVLQAAQAVSALYNVRQLDQLDVRKQIDQILSFQQEDGSWPELLAFGDQSLKFGVVGRIGHGSDLITSAFCIEALERLIDTLKF
ncbi:MAG: hypothetical protein OXC80_01540 [Gammaproteobacteria bacterium]|nr:hypothetical protein [Gammaproteobacteria bacterium]